MRAARLHRYGGPEVIQIDEVPVPAPGPGQVRVRVVASSVNPVDVKLRAGAQRAVVRWSLPHTLGLDVAGVVDAVGPGVQRFRVGDAVFGSPDHHGEGTCAAFVVAKAAQLALAPTTIPLADAGALPLVGLTAWDCLVRAADVKPGEHVVVMNGSGGVGTVAVQLAAALGAEVSATCSPRNAPLLTTLGAARTVDYREPAWWTAVPPADVVLVGVGGDGVWQALQATRRGGRVTAIVGDVPRHVARWGASLGVVVAGAHMAKDTVRGALRGVRVRHVVRHPDGAALEALARLVDAGRVRPVVHARFPLDALADAHREVEAGHVVGKVVVDIGEHGAR